MNSINPSLIPFDFEGTPVRVGQLGDEPIWFISDIERALQHKNLRRTIDRLVPDDEKGVAICYTLGGDQEMGYLTEAGLYRVIFRSTLPLAEKLRRFVFHEVLPSVRRHGFYSPRPAWLDRMNSLISQGVPEDMAKMAAMIDMGVNPTVAAKLSVVAPKFAASTLNPPPDEHEADKEFLDALAPRVSYTFSELAELCLKHGLLPQIVTPDTFKNGNLTDRANSSLGIRLQRIAMRDRRFLITGKGRARRFTMHPDKAS